MDKICTKNTPEIIEVPPELRGLSDDEIIRNSEKKERPFSGKRKKGALRPSKRERLALKQGVQEKEAEQIAAEIFGAASSQAGKKAQPGQKKHSVLKSAFTDHSESLSKMTVSPFGIGPSTEPKPEPKSMISEAPKPISGRVLKVSFGAKTGEKPKAVIVSAADHERQRNEERAKKIQAFFKEKHPEATAMPDGAPIKRGRGRPRKNPLS